MKAPIAVALDAPDLTAGRALAEAVAGHVEVLKLGLEITLLGGPVAAAAITEGLDVDVFFDLKLHDIPNTVAGAIRSIRHLRPRFVTVHASGGEAMIAAAADAAPEIDIVAVTLLTSMDASDAAAVGFGPSPEDLVTRLATLAVNAGAKAIVCSPSEVSAVRRAVGPGITLITPGVRPAGSAAGDQRRVATPEQALADGADLLVIGRPISAAADPAAAAERIAASIAASITGQTAASHPASRPAPRA